MHWLTIPDYVRVSDEEPEDEIKVSVERKRINLAPIDNEENVEVIEKEEAISIEEDCEGFGEEK